MEWLPLIGALLLYAFCAGMEVALTRANKLYVELQRQQGSLWARLVAMPVEQPARTVLALRTCATLAAVVFGWSALQVALDRSHEAVPLALTIALAIVVAGLLLAVFGEALPDLLCRIDPHAALMAGALPLRLLHAAAWLPTAGLERIQRAINSHYGGAAAQPGHTFGRPDLDGLLQGAGKAPDGEEPLDAEVEYFRNTLALSNTKVRELMVPRAEIIAIPVDAPVSELQQRFVDSGLSKLLVYKDGIDNIIGYVHGNELFRRPRTIRQVMRPVPFVPGTMPADQVLQLFTKRRTHVAVVVDEFGGTAGLLTIEDVVETIVGDIDDEHDQDELVEQPTGPGTYAFSARLEVAEVNERYGLTLPLDDDYDTLGGLVLHRLGGLPQQGTTLEVGRYRITVVNVTGGRVDLLQLTDTGVATA